MAGHDFSIIAASSINLTQEDTICKKKLEIFSNIFHLAQGRQSKKLRETLNKHEKSQGSRSVTERLVVQPVH
jgi:hypothetical protein